MILMMALSTFVSSAGRYNALKFTSKAGDIYTVVADNLEIQINGNDISFNNTDITIPLNSLVSMEFTDYDDNPAEINSVIPDMEGVVTVYNMNGTMIGSFGSYSEALGSLSHGVFVIKDTNGNSLKVSMIK